MNFSRVFWQTSSICLNLEIDLVTLKVPDNFKKKIIFFFDPILFNIGLFYKFIGLVFKCQGLLEVEDLVDNLFFFLGLNKKRLTNSAILISVMQLTATQIQ